MKIIGDASKQLNKINYCRIKERTGRELIITFTKPTRGRIELKYKGVLWNTDAFIL